MDRSIALGRPAKKRFIRAAANSVRQQNGHPDPVSRQWTYRFLKRHPEYHQRRTKPLSYERQAAQDKDSIDAHFQNFDTLRKKGSGALPENIWNFDETGFRIGCLQGQLVFTHTTCKAVYLADPKNRELITTVKTISGTGATIDPMVILAGSVLKEKYFNNDLNPGVLFGISESGYSNDQLALQYIKHFDRNTKPQDPEAWRILIMDGHGSHLTCEFVDYCTANKISPFLLPPHLTHILQPLDIGVFQSYKHYHQELLEEAVRYAGLDFDCTEFLTLLHKMRELTMKRRVIKSAFEKVYSN
jgi:hypothetical protein